LLGAASQLCSLPAGHSWQRHQISFWLFNVVLSGTSPFSHSHAALLRAAA